MGLIAWYCSQVYDQTVTRNVIDDMDALTIRLASEGKLRYRGGKYGVTGRTVQLIQRFGYFRVHTAITNRVNKIRRLQGVAVNN